MHNHQGQLSTFFCHNNGQYKDYILAINIGNLQHDMAMFIRYNKPTYTFIHFDPNVKATSQIATAFIKLFGRNSQRYGYHSQDENISGNCTQLAWMEIIKFMLKGENAFARSDLKQFCNLTDTYLSKEEAEEAKVKEVNRSRKYDNTIRNQYKYSNSI